MDMRKLINICEGKFSTKEMLKESNKGSTIRMSERDVKSLGIDLDELPNAGPNPVISGMRKYYGEDAILLKVGQYLYNASADENVLNILRKNHLIEESMNEDIDMFGYDSDDTTLRRIDITELVQQNPRLVAMDGKEIAKRTDNYTEGFDYELEKTEDGIYNLIEKNSRNMNESLYEDETDEGNPWAIDARDMHTGKHNLLVFGSKSDADKAYVLLKKLESDERRQKQVYHDQESTQYFFNRLKIEDQFEINFRDLDGSGEYEHNGTIYNIVNDGNSIDIYF